ncbi:hypothetical protein HJC23_001235 [Cyclotella cryptica]|uniref:Bud22 domain-containing protein n=1 Tax=Cyclotella cryptica TaxID=29204 RepID=A0ABD3QPD7_9STRA|eukprot:CCRYP_003880-RA/>CCRYP_003880-RA protein AED:0.02 eAED:-0.02 QI:0/-1/0/1/-1/1/1/0/439
MRSSKIASIQHNVANDVDGKLPESDSSGSSKNDAKEDNKRKRPHIKHNSPEEQYRIECTERCSKLFHTSSKQMHKEAKVVKSFECQKIVRSIKAVKESTNTQAGGRNEENRGGADNNKTLKKVHALEQKLERTKKLDLEVLVKVALKRLGVLTLDPKVTKYLAERDHSNVDDMNDGQHDGGAGQNASSQSEDPFYQALIENMLRHKRLSTVMDQINDKVTEYHNWMTHREDILQGLIHGEELKGENKKKKKQNSQRIDRNETLIVAGTQKRRKIDLGGHEGTSGLFIGSLSGQTVEGYSEDDEEAGGYDQYDEDDLFQKKKKNRPGQRARKAKAMAIEARKAGKTWDSSVNWREKKSSAEEKSNTARQRNLNHESNTSNTQVKAKRGETMKAVTSTSQKIATMGKSWKEEGNAHPSWAAAATRKSQGIAKFQGTKISFD